MNSHSLILAAGSIAAPPWWAIAPFVVILLAIAVLPLIPATHHWWEKNRNKLLIAGVLGALTLAYYLLRGEGYHGAAPGSATLVKVLQHALLDEYIPFIVLLFALFTISGGIVVRGDLRATPLVNTSILAIGGVIASVIGTTGASMVLIRLLLRTNSERKRVVHTFVFFIFIVSNAGGMLLPTGDPPLFLGYLRGVPFFWTLNLWVEWAVALGILLFVYFIWDCRAFARETTIAVVRDHRDREPLRLAGLLNCVWLLLIVGICATVAHGLAVPGTDWRPPQFLREGLLLVITGLAWWTTAPALRRQNQFAFTPIGEVAALFIGIFITMQAPIELLHVLAPRFADQGFVHPWQYFWATGMLSSFLDNAPTYVIFLETANQLTHQPGPGILRLITGDYIREDLLAAVSCGAVLMGANTYIGNGPNFMVKSIVENSGVKMPSFFGFMLYSGLILLPIFALLTWLFFV